MASAWKVLTILVLEVNVLLYYGAVCLAATPTNSTAAGHVMLSGASLPVTTPIDTTNQTTTANGSTSGHTVSSITNSTTQSNTTPMTSHTTTPSPSSSPSPHTPTSTSSTHSSTSTTITTSPPSVNNDTHEDDGQRLSYEKIEEIDAVSSGQQPFHLNGSQVDTIKIDDHKYYESRRVSGKEATLLWVELDGVASERVITHDMLSDAHRRAARVELSFEFPFYGHMVSNITIATGGFLYTGDYLHSWLAATQYIAPLMANFDTTNATNATIKYADNGTAFTVQWGNVPLREALHAHFTFQVTIHKSGDIVFVYRHIPVNVTSIKSHQHPVKVGLSDAYIFDRTIFLVKRKTIYEYHRIDLRHYSIANNSGIVFRALPNCVSMSTCDQCLTHPTVQFDCVWCARLGRCSDGLDRHRQRWLQASCDTHYVANATQCAAAAAAAAAGSAGSWTPTGLPDPRHSGHVTPPPPLSPHDHASLPTHTAVAAKTADSVMSSSSMASLILIASVVVLIISWLLYAYLYPHSTSGQILIRYRPSQWRMRRGEARYTAASIHM